MEPQISIYLQQLLLCEEKLSDTQIRDLQKQFEFSFPQEYIEVLKEYNGGEGEVGNEGWLCLFAAKDLYDVNNTWYKILMDDIPEYFLFGKDAADTGYAFHKYNHSYHAFGLMSNFETDNITFCGNSFLEFVTALSEGKCY